MFVVKNALRSVSRNKGRNLLIGIIVIIIAMAATVSLAIRSAAQNARETGVANTTVTATIGVNRENAIGNASNSGSDEENSDSSSSDSRAGTDSSSTPGSIDSGSAPSRDDMREALNIDALTLEDYEYYAESTSMPLSTYYTVQTTVNATDDFEPVSSSTASSSTSTDSNSDNDADANSDNSDSSRSSDNSTDNTEGGFGGAGGGGQMGGGDGGFTTGDFTLTGFSSDTAVANDANSFTMDEGEAFTYGTDAVDQVIISRNLADFNGLSVGDTITVANPNDESTTYELTIVGIYRTTSTENTSAAGPMGGTSMDSDNAIYTSVATLEELGLFNTTTSDSDSDSDGDAESDSDSDSSASSTSSASDLQTQLSFTYVLSNATDYYTFVDDVTAAGLDDNYVVSSTDVEQYESSLVPLNNVANFALTLLAIVLGVGGIVLIVINLFNIRERKYEIGVLLAIGIRKSKVAGQFLVELLGVTMVGIIIGVAGGSAAAVPVANYLLAEQVSAASSEEESTLEQFGREADLPGSPDAMGEAPDNMAGGAGRLDGAGDASSTDSADGSDSADSADSSENASSSEAAQSSDSDAQSGDLSDGDDEDARGGFGGFSEYLDTINATVNLGVVAQMVLIGLLLTVVSSLVGIVSIVRYEPLQILADRS